MDHERLTKCFRRIKRKVNKKAKKVFIKNIKKIVTRNGDHLKDMPSWIKNTESVVLEAVRNKGFALYYASERLQNDKKIALEAVKQWDAL